MSSKFLVDTHILLWIFTDPQKLSPTIRAVLNDSDAEVYYSPISLWEISIKYGLGKLSISGISPEEFFVELDKSFLHCKPLDNESLITSYQLPHLHKDPFDRMLFWEAIRDGFTLLSVDAESEAYTESGLHVLR